MKQKRTDLRLGYICNNNCSFCVTQNNRALFKDFDTAKVKDLIRQARENGSIEINFTGGEPTIRQDLLELVDYAREKGFKTIMITTNGRMLSYEDFAQELATRGVNKYMISLHAHDATLYRKLTGANGFDEVIDGIRTVRQLTDLVWLSFVVTKANYKILPEYVKFVSKLNIPNLQMTYFISAGFKDDMVRRNLPRFKDAIPIIKKAIDLGYSLGLKHISVMDVPICQLQGYEKNINEFSISDLEIHAPDPMGSTKNYNASRKTNKVKFAQCNDCRHEHICEGVWPEYPKLYGDSEFIPVQ